VGLRIEVDRDRCMGSGNCSFHAPATLDLDDDGVAMVLDPEGDSPTKIRLAVEGCPTGALSVTES